MEIKEKRKKYGNKFNLFSRKYIKSRISKETVSIQSAITLIALIITIIILLILCRDCTKSNFRRKWYYKKGRTKQ